MRIVAIDHVQLAMPAGREEEAIAFYEGLLGLVQVPKPLNLAARGGCWFERDGAKVHLGVEAEFSPARKAHPALLVEDLPALVERLRAGGATPADDEPESIRGHRCLVKLSSTLLVRPATAEHTHSRRTP